MNLIVLDTNVVVSALRSRRGAAFAILRRIGEAWTPLISVPLILEYEAVGLREADRLNISPQSALQLRLPVQNHRHRQHIRGLVANDGQELLAVRGNYVGISSRTDERRFK